MGEKKSIGFKYAIPKIKDEGSYKKVDLDELSNISRAVCEAEKEMSKRRGFKIRTEFYSYSNSDTLSRGNYKHSIDVKISSTELPHVKLEEVAFEFMGKVPYKPIAGQARSDTFHKIDEYVPEGVSV